MQVRFRASPMLAAHILYLAEEQSDWRDGMLQRVAVNNRYLFDGDIVRQQWDVFTRQGDALAGQRLQGKRAAAFDRAHPAFAAHWNPDAFGLPWLGDYAASGPETRPDLGLPAPLPRDLTPPLALLFYGVRFLPPRQETEAVFLPGFKGERLVRVPLAPQRWGEGTAWRATLHYHALSRTEPSTADAWVAPDRTLRDVAMSLHGDGRSATGRVSLVGCSGSDAP